MTPTKDTQSSTDDGSHDNSTPYTNDAHPDGVPPTYEIAPW